MNNGACAQESHEVKGEAVLKYFFKFHRLNQSWIEKRCDHFAKDFITKRIPQAVDCSRAVLPS